MKAEKIFKKCNINNKVIKISQEKKHRYTTAMSTFPQIYYVAKNDIGLIGGLDDFTEVLDTHTLHFRIKPKLAKTLNKITNLIFG
jgi:hypothetical protein